MGCGCGKAKTYTQTAPAVIGAPNGMPAEHYRTTVSILGLKAGAEFWATGSSVAAMASSRWIVLIPG